MSPEISERSFEEAIECALLQTGPDACAGEANAVRETPPPYGDTPPGGYRKRKPEDYDRTLCLLPRDVLDFVHATQPKERKKLEQHHGAAVRSLDGCRLFVGRRAVGTRGGPARKLVALQGIPPLILAAEASYHASYDHCTARCPAQIGVEIGCVRLARIGIRGNVR